MPIVPRLDPNPVPVAPLPGVRVSTDVPSAAIGVAAQPDLSGFQRQLTDIVQRERQKADTTALLDADNQLATLQTDLHTAASQRRGRDAMGATADVAQQWQKGVSTITANLGTDEQREAFSRRASSRWNTLYEAVETHTAAESQQYQEQTTSDALKNRLTHATEFYQQPAAIAEAVKETKDIVTMFGASQGWSPDTVDAKTAAAVTQIHASVLDRMVANRQDLAAVDYLTAHRDEMSGQPLIQAENLVGRGSVMGAGQRAADGILQSAPSLTAALASAGVILDPQVREETEQRVRRGFEDRALAQREQQLKQEVDAGAVVLKTGRFDEIPAKLLVGLTPDQIRGLKLQEESLRRRPSDPDTLAKLRNTSANAPDQFKTLNLGEYRDQLSPADLTALQTRQRTLLDADRRAAAAAASTARTRQQKELTRLQRSVGALQGLGLGAAMDSATAGDRRRIKVLQDSLRASTAPGSPLPSAAPAGSGPPAPAAALPQFHLPGPKRPEPDASDRLASAMTVPSTWLDHARANPDYAAYLAAMGVSIE